MPTTQLAPESDVLGGPTPPPRQGSVVILRSGEFRWGNLPHQTCATGQNCLHHFHTAATKSKAGNQFNVLKIHFRFTDNGWVTKLFWRFFYLFTILTRCIQIAPLQVSILVAHESKRTEYSNVGWLFCTPAPPKFTKKLAVDSFFNFGSWSKQK